MSGIFISYRRDDATTEARLLFDRLSASLGPDRVFLDAVTLQPGEDFGAAIREKVGFCDALIAVIGKQWINSATPDGRRRLDDPEDWVRTEIASALEQGVRVIPVLVNGAPLPSARQLPAPLAALPNHHAIEFRSAHIAGDLERLERTLVPLLSGGSGAVSWMALLTRRHRALDPLTLERPGTLRRALAFLLMTILLSEALRLPIAARAGLPYWNPAYLLADVVVNGVEWLAIGTVLHFAMRTLGGRATVQKSIAITSFMSIWLPIIALSQMPVWGLRVSVTKDMSDLAWEPGATVEKMTAFVNHLGVFGTVRVVVSFVLATLLWSLLLTSLYAAFRTVHHLSTARAMAAFALGGAASVAFIALLYAPALGAVYAAFGIPVR